MLNNSDANPLYDWRDCYDDPDKEALAPVFCPCQIRPRLGYRVTTNGFHLPAWKVEDLGRELSHQAKERLQDDKELSIPITFLLLNGKLSEGEKRSATHMAKSGSMKRRTRAVIGSSCAFGKMGAGSVSTFEQVPCSRCQQRIFEKENRELFTCQSEPWGKKHRTIRNTTRESSLKTSARDARA